MLYIGRFTYLNRLLKKLIMELKKLLSFAGATTGAGGAGAVVGVGAGSGGETTAGGGIGAAMGLAAG